MGGTKQAHRSGKVVRIAGFGVLPALYQGGTPVSVILSPSGDVVLKHHGSAKWDSPSITALLKGLSAFTPQPAAH